MQVAGRQEANPLTRVPFSAPHRAACAATQQHQLVDCRDTKRLQRYETAVTKEELQRRPYSHARSWFDSLVATVWHTRHAREVACGLRECTRHHTVGRVGYQIRSTLASGWSRVELRLPVHRGRRRHSSCNTQRRRRVGRQTKTTSARGRASSLHQRLRLPTHGAAGANLNQASYSPPTHDLRRHGLAKKQKTHDPSRQGVGLGKFFFSLS